MFTMEFDINVAEQVWKEEALAKGREMGRAEGRQEGRAEGWQEGSREGEARGRQAGRSEGQREILELINQGYTIEQIKEQLGKHL
jgi:flagellar biosynthesis/type III secretory pathway protein FliH